MTDDEMFHLSSLSVTHFTGSLVAIRSQLREARSLGGFFAFRFFWKKSQQRAWRELSLRTTIDSIGALVDYSWPPEELLTLDIEDFQPCLTYRDPLDPWAKSGTYWIRAAKFNFTKEKWTIRRLDKWDYGQFGNEGSIVRSLSPGEQEWLDLNFGRLKPGGMW